MMDVEELELETLKSVKQEDAPFVLTTRRFRRTVSQGMHVWRSTTRNFETSEEIEHVEIACPGYELTSRGPVHKAKESN